MKKKYIIISLLIVIIICSIFVFINIYKQQKHNNELEAVKIFNKNATIKVFVSYSSNNISDIQKKLENINYVKNVKFISSEDALKDMEKELGENVINNNSDYTNLLPSSFFITLNINNIDDFEKVKYLKNDIINIKGIDDNIISGFETLIEVYEEIGIKGMKAYDTVLTIMNEQGVDEAISYLDEHEEIRKLLKDFIYF